MRDDQGLCDGSIEAAVLGVPENVSGLSLAILPSDLEQAYSQALFTPGRLRSRAESLRFFPCSQNALQNGQIAPCPFRRHSFSMAPKHGCSSAAIVV